MTVAVIDVKVNMCTFADGLSDEQLCALLTGRCEQAAQIRKEFFDHALSAGYCSQCCRLVARAMATLSKCFTSDETHALCVEAQERYEKLKRQ